MSTGKLPPSERSLVVTAAALMLAAGVMSFAFLDRETALPWMTTMAAALIVAALVYAAILQMRRSAQELHAFYATVQQSNRDLEQRLAERTANLKEVDDEIRHLGDVVGRDLRTPLTNIMGFTGELETLRNGVFARAKSFGIDDAGAKALRRDFDEALWFIRSSVAKTDRLIGAILDLSQLSRRGLKAEVVDLDRMARSLATDLTHRVDKGGIRLALGKLPTIVSDRLALEQILSHLLDNAAKYLRDDLPGHIAISASETEAGTIEIAVADNGRGIAPEDQPRIFDLFCRAGTQTSPGDGIGLALVRTLVRRLGGSVRLESEVGRGSTFTIALPKTAAP
jgi:signal transduction histidine kinase